MSAEVEEQAASDEGEGQLEFASILFLDLVGYSTKPADEQVRLIRQLQSLARETPERRRAEKSNTLVGAPAGDGFALAFLGGDIAAPLRCAIQLAKLLNERGRGIAVRMGIHCGAVYRYWDVNDNQNLSGPGINDAARVMDVGDDRHIILSEDAASMLRQDARFRPNLHHLGVVTVKHGRIIAISNYVQPEEGIGNAAMPGKLVAAGGAAAPFVSSTLPQVSRELEQESEADERDLAKPPLESPHTPVAVLVPRPPERTEPVPPEATTAAQTWAKEQASDERPGQFVARVLAVTYTRGLKGGDALTYALQTKDNEPAPQPSSKAIQVDNLRAALAAFEGTVTDLTDLARAGEKNRGKLGIEAAATAIAQQVLPEQGLAKLVGRGVHPQLFLFQDVAGQIPWEALEERYFECPNHPGYVLASAATPVEPFCTRCPTAMKPVLGKLAVELQLTHRVQGPQPPAAAGNQFALFEDPTEDLYKDKGGLCARHTDEICRLLTEVGYEVKRYRGASVTLECVEHVLTNPSVVGIYYFGHGAFEEGEGYLQLGDHRLTAGRIKDLQATTPFIFLNACEGASFGQGWKLEQQSRSVAAELAAPSQWRNVIAPIFPIVGTQAAESALAFFRVAAVSSLGEALQVARRESLARYREGIPDLAWFLYRHFGGAERCLPAAKLVPAIDRTHGAGSPGSAYVRIFDAADQLDSSVFGFSVDNVLSAASRRRSEHGRARISVLDFGVGLLRHGDLARFILSRGEHSNADLDTDLDALKAPLPSEGSASGSGKPPTNGETESAGTTHGSAWRNRRDFEPDLIQLLRSSDRDAQGHPDKDRRISERDVLLKLLDDARWDELMERCQRAEDFRDAGDGKSSTAPGFRAAVDAVVFERLVDENGQIPLVRLAPEARAVIDAAHMLAQQRGARSISNRLFLAAFLRDPRSEAVRRYREIVSTEEQASERPTAEELFEFMLAVADGDVASPGTFGLSHELCQRIVEPVLVDARVASPWAPVSETCLLEAFCQRANPDFKEWLQARTRLAMDELGRVREEADTVEGGPAWMSALDPSARRVVAAAHRLSEQIGSFPIKNSILLAAFFQDENGFAVQLLPAGTRFQELRDWLIRGNVLYRPPQKFPLNDEACKRAIAPAVHKAIEMRADESVLVNELGLFIAFCYVVPDALKERLAKSQFGLHLDLLLVKFVERLMEMSTAQEQHQGAPPAPLSPKQTLPVAPSVPSRTSPSSASAAPSSLNPPDPATTAAGEIQLVMSDGLEQGQFDDDAWRCLVRAGLWARDHGWQEVRSPHLFASLVKEHVPVPSFGLLRPEEEKSLISLVLGLVPRASAQATTQVKLSSNVVAILMRAVACAKAASRTRVGLEDLLIGFFEGADRGGVVGDLLRNLGQPAQGPGRGMAPSMAPGGSPAQGHSVLKAVGRDLTERAQKGEIAEVVGRDAEIGEALRCLMQSENANPLLVGEAGVGKTAIVEGLAQRLVTNPVPQLQGTRIIELQAGALLANTRFRGDFEQRIQALLAEARGNVVLFIDEIHSLMGAGTSEAGGPDTGDMLKAALARGELRLIGATTQTEYRHTIARDRALARRFQLIKVDPPSREATLQILAARRDHLEKFHRVAISSEALAAAVDMSGRHMLDRQWPAKARDVIEQACVLVASQPAASAGGTAPVTAEHVVSVVSRITGIPLERLSASESALLGTLARRLDQRIVGQSEAIHTVVDAIRAGRHGLSAGQKPAGVFLLVGPPGVGKTELAKVLAEEVYGGKDGLIRFDMAEFSEPHSVAKIVGSPPGYVGYRQGARLVEELRQRPHSVLLLDEIEHAHEDVLAVFLRLFSEGTIADQEGNLADARNALVILTSNVVAVEPERGGIGFATAGAVAAGPTQAALRIAAEKHLPRKLVDRLDSIIRFRALDARDLAAIARQKVDEVVNNARANHGLSVSLAPDLLEWLAARAMQADTGAARTIARIVDENVSRPLGQWLSRGGAERAASVVMRVQSDQVEIEPAPVDSN
jgi:ATP-dependent Clp protease ATP-binding subunit ClpC